jgi:phosphoribosylformylglycinamidine synthase
VATVLECAANLACVGATPLGTTNNLNFGNPEKPHVAWQLTEAVRGIGDACRALDAPIVGGNVSLYNEAPSGPIYPTPVIGMVGLLPDAARCGHLGFVEEGEAIALVGHFHPSPDASELARLRGEPLPDGLPEIDVGQVAATQAAVREAVRGGRISSAHDISEGGLAVALAECCLGGSIGAEVEIDPQALAEGSLEAALFGEAPGGFILSGHQGAIEELASRVGLAVIGHVGGERLTLTAGDERLEWTLDELRAAHEGLAVCFP